MRSPEVIVLDDDEDEKEEQGQERARAGRKRARSSGSSGSSGEDSAAAQRRRIMEFAAQAIGAESAAAVAGGRDAGGGESAPPPAQPNALLAALHRERLQRRGGAGAPKGASGSRALRQTRLDAAMFASQKLTQAQQEGKGSSGSSASPKAVKLLTWNVWFDKRMIEERMRAIDQVILRERPDVICLQEVTAEILELFIAESRWYSKFYFVHRREQQHKPYFAALFVRIEWKNFVSAAQVSPFNNSMMGRDLLSCRIETPFLPSLLVATSHLESPLPPFKGAALNSQKRVAQLSTSLVDLDNAQCSDTIFAGDFNWDNFGDGDPDEMFGDRGWMDLWPRLNSTSGGYTIDTRVNKMLTYNLRKRLDRILAKLCKFEAKRMRMVGLDPIPGVTWRSARKEHPVFPSDHFGLLVELQAV